MPASPENNSGHVQAARSVVKLGLMLVFIVVSAVAAVLWYVERLQTDLIKDNARTSAVQIANAVAEFRAVYTDEVVTNARVAGIKVSHDYADHARAIPLPATLSMTLGARLSEKVGEQ
jgi:sensor histidine kinase regulating citrate/malate metabolism